MSEEIKRVSVQIQGRDQLDCQLTFKTVSGQSTLQAATIKATGCLRFLRLTEDFRKSLNLAIDSKSCHDLQFLNPPDGNGHAEILFRELIMKLQDQWLFPYSDVEICHCRAVPTHVVDAAIIGGAHSLDQVRRQTSACTSCGTCRPDIEKIFQLRLQSQIK